MNKQINAAIQLLPIGATENKIELIDKAIDLINRSGLNYKVCPFETVVEGSPEKVFKLIDDIRSQCLQNECPELLINIKIHAATRDLFFDEKLEKYPDA
jgi:uncharacterized protein YqgV (UPF0045/DUF77 family)